MELSNKVKMALSQEHISIDSIRNLTKDEFIQQFKDSSNKTLKTASQKMSQYHNKQIKRDLLVNLVEKDGKLTENRRKYNKSVYTTFCVMLGIIEKYGYDGEFFYIPIEYLANSAGTSPRTAKKAINTALKYNVLIFNGYDKSHSDFAMCKFTLNDKDTLVQWIQHGEKMYGDIKEEYIHESLIANTKKSIKNNDEKKAKDALKAMKECPYLIKAFNESNIYDGYFSQKFLLDGSLRALSHFTLTKNPENHPEVDINLFERHRILVELQNNLHSQAYTEYDLSASIYTLSYYLKNGDFPTQEFYDIFAYELKKKYHGDTHLDKLKVNKVLRKKIKNYCMRIYMHGYNPVGKGNYFGKCKSIYLETGHLYKPILKEIEFIDEIYEYITQSKIEEKLDLIEEYTKFFQYSYEIMQKLCDIKKKKIFLYESLLCSLLIQMGTDYGVQIVNAYDGFYMPEDFIDTFKNILVPKAYQQVKEIYDTYNAKSIREKNKELLSYLIKIGSIYEINNRKYVKIKDLYLDYYKYDVVRTLY